jgi:hypothetical protein
LSSSTRGRGQGGRPRAHGRGHVARSESNFSDKSAVPNSSDTETLDPPLREGARNEGRAFRQLSEDELHLSDASAGREMDIDVDMDRNTEPSPPIRPSYAGAGGVRLGNRAMPEPADEEFYVDASPPPEREQIRNNFWSPSSLPFMGSESSHTLAGPPSSHTLGRSDSSQPPPSDDLDPEPPPSEFRSHSRSPGRPIHNLFYYIWPDPIRDSEEARTARPRQNLFPEPMLPCASSGSALINLLENLSLSINPEHERMILWLLEQYINPFGRFHTGEAV